jgi:oligopeptide transport system ATP-binding protein
VILEVRDLIKYFKLPSGLFKAPRELKAVDGVSLSLAKSQTLGIVGESGCGKSTLGRTIMRLYDADQGQIVFDGQDVSKLKGKELKPLRKRLQMVFQDPYSSLNPKMTVEQTLLEPLYIHNIAAPKDRRDIVIKLLDTVGLDSSALLRYPHEFSGGQRQRIGIARALSLKPDVIIADEPVSALDVSVQSQILNLLKDIQDEFGVSFLFIAHDLAVVKHISHRVCVMYLGKIVEEASCEDLFTRPSHPYTRALLDAVPSITLNEREKRMRLSGDIPSATKVPSGCAFHPRCPYAQDRCKTERPEKRTTGDMSHLVACHYPLE